MSNWRDSASFCNSIPKNKESHTWLINMVIKFGARAVLLLLFQMAAPDSPASEVFSTCPLHQNKKSPFDDFRMAARGRSFVSVGWVAAWRGQTERRHGERGAEGKSATNLCSSHAPWQSRRQVICLYCVFPDAAAPLGDEIL